MTDLAAFVSARLDERQELAGEPRTWKVTHHECGQWGPCDEPCGEAAQCAEGRCWHKVIGGSDGMTIYDEGGHDEADAAHIAGHDPAWALRDVAAKRAILARHAKAGCDDEWGGVHCGWCSSPEAETPWPCPDVLDLAAIDSGHPDYDTGWAAG